MRPIYFLQGPQAHNKVWIRMKMIYPEILEIGEEDSVDSLDGDHQVPTHNQGLKNWESDVLDVLQDRWVVIIF